MPDTVEQPQINVNCFVIAPQTSQQISLFKSGGKSFS
jgi:hypothetical protein